MWPPLEGSHGEEGGLISISGWGARLTLSLHPHPGGCPTNRGMSWVQGMLLARSLSRSWRGICGAALTGAPFSQVTASQAAIRVEKGRQTGLGFAPKPFRIHPVVKPACGGRGAVETDVGCSICSEGLLNVSYSF